MQADPYIHAGKFTQRYNRYAYVLNNPVAITDPSGFFFKKLLGGLFSGLGLNKLLGAIANNQFLSDAVKIGINSVYGCQSWCSAAFGPATTFAATGMSH